MKYRRLGRTELQVSAVSLGGAYLMGTDRDDAESNACAILQCAADLGVNYIDTAPLYGQSEALLGGALSSVRSDFYVSSKVGFDPEDFDYTCDAVLASLERSVRRLGVDQLAVAQIHEVNLAGWDRIVERGGTLEGLRAAQKEGLCKYIGITGRAIPLLASLADTGEFDTVLFYRDYHPCQLLASRELLPAAARSDMGVVAATVLAGGLYVGGEDQRKELDLLNASERSRAQRILERLEEIDGTLPQAAFRYVLSDARISTVSSGAANVDQLCEVAVAADMQPVSDELIEWIAEEDRSGPAEAVL